MKMSTITMSVILLAAFAACGETVTTPEPTSTSTSTGTGTGGMDGGQATCGDHTCKADEFCVKRVHSQDAGPVPPTWECQLFWQCSEPTCACALMSFVSASCIAPMCTSESPIVMIQCDDLN